MVVKVLGPNNGRRALFFASYPAHRWALTFAPMAQLSEKAMAELRDYLEVQGISWAKEFIAGRKAWLESKGIRATGELIRSLQAEVTSTLEAAAQQRIEISFATPGRYIEIPTLKPAAGGAEYISALETWIEKKGLRETMTQRLIQRRNLRTAPPSILNQLAWSIAVSRAKKYRRRQWYNKPKSAAITELYNRVAANLPDLVAREIGAAFKQ